MTDTSLMDALALIASRPVGPTIDRDRGELLARRLRGEVQLDRDRQEYLTERLASIGQQRVLDADPNAAIRYSDEMLAGLQQRIDSKRDTSKGLWGALVDSGAFILDVIDTPRAAVTSFVKEVGDVFDSSEGTDASFGDFLQQTRDNIGFGEVLQEFAPGLGEVEMFGVRPLDNAAGFLGEVLLDPFTWLSLGTIPLARQGTMGLVRAANALGDAATARRLFQGGVAAVSAEDIARIANQARDAGIRGFEGGADAVRGGVHFRIPGTGGIAQAVSGGRITPRTIQVLSHDNRVLQILPRTAVNRSAQRLRRTQFGRLLGGDRAELKAIVRSADATDEQWHMAFDAIDIDNVARGREKMFNEILERRVATVRRAVDQAGFSGEDAYHAMGSDVAPEGWDEGLWRQLKDLGDAVADEANELARYNPDDPDFILRREDWQPAVVTEEFGRYIAAMRRPEASHLDLAGFERRANIVAGGNFMGRELVAASAHPAALTPRQQAQSIVREEAEAWGEDFINWFQTDLWSAMAQQLRTVGRRVRGTNIEHGMRTRGHGVDAFTTHLDEVELRRERAWHAAERIVSAHTRRVSRAESRLTAATEAAAEADDASRAAAKRERDALRARAAARAGVDMPDPSSEAVGLRTVADELNEMAEEARRALDEFDRASTRDVLRLENMAANAERVATHLGDELVRMRRGLATLARKRDEVWREAAEAAESFDDELDDAAERLGELHRLESDLAELDEMVALAEADVALAAAPRAELEAAIQRSATNVARAQKPLRQLEDLAEMLELRALASSRLNTLEGNWDQQIRVLAGELDLEPDLAAVRDFQSRLRRFVDAEARQVAAFRGEAADAFGVAESNLTDLQAWRESVQDEIGRLAPTDPALARELGMTLRRLEVADTGYLSYGSQDVWFHGIGPNHLDLDLGRTADDLTDRARTTHEWDTHVGLHVAQNDQYALQYARTPGNDPGLIPEKVVGVRIRAENPVVFGADPSRFGRAQGDVRVPYRGGAARGDGLVGYHTAMFDSAVWHGHIDVGTALRAEGQDQLADLFEGFVAAGEDASVALRHAATTVAEYDDPLFDLIDEGWLDEDAAAMLRAVGEADGPSGMSVMVAGLEATIEGAEDQFDDTVARLVGEFESRGLEPRYAGDLSDADFFDRYIYPWTGERGGAGSNVGSAGSTSVDPATMRAIVESFKDDLRLQGYDSIVYSLRGDGGQWAAVPLDPAQVEIAPAIRGGEADAIGAARGVTSSVESSTTRADLTRTRTDVQPFMEQLAAPETRRALETSWGGDGGKLVRSTNQAFEDVLESVQVAVRGDRDNVLAVARNIGTARQRLTSAVASWRRAAAAADGPDAARVQQIADDTEVAIRQLLSDSTEAHHALMRAVSDARQIGSDVATATSRELVTTIDNHITALRLNRYQRVQDMYDDAGALDSRLVAHIESAQGRAVDLVDKARASSARVDELRDKLRTARNTHEAGVEAHEAEELRLRLSADDMVRSADEYEARAAAEAEGALAEATIETLQAQRGRVASVAESVRLHAEAELAAAELTRVRGVAEDMEARWAAMPMGGRVEVVEATIREGWSRIGANTMLPDEIVEGLQNVNRIVGHRSTSRTLQGIDTITELFKSWAIATPGFHMRNSFGGLFNNALAGVNVRRYRQFHALYGPVRRTLDAGGGIDAQVTAMRESRGARSLVNRGREDVVDSMEQLIRNGTLSGGQSRELERARRISETGIRGQHFNPLSPNFAFVNFARRPATHIENYLRGSLALDRLMGGHGIHQAVSDVYRFHFDYDDLSAFERGVLRRVIPFYTWTRKNLPLQIEMMLTNPKVYNRVGSVKREVERETEAEELVPQWYAERFHIRLPIGGNVFGGEQGDVAYLVPDLPFTELDRALDPHQIIASSNPLVKAPLERLTNHSFFFDSPYIDAYRPMPSPWEVALAPFMPALNEAGVVARRDDGRSMMLPADMATIESFFPVFSQSRRLVPSGDDEKTRDRWEQNVVNYVFGLGIRVNTEISREAEQTRREFEERDVARLEASLES